MFAIHSKVELLKRSNRTPLSNYARHYYDLFQLSSEQPEVLGAMLRSAEYCLHQERLRRDQPCSFPEELFSSREGMSFTQSNALFPPADLAAAIGAEYEAQCRMLCYGPYPAWADVQARFLNMRDLL